MPLVHLLSALTTLAALERIEPVDPHDGAVLVQPSEVRFIETKWSETVLRGRPWVPNRRLATLAKGTRLVVRGTVDSRDRSGCAGKPWYAVYPFGYICSTEVRTSKRPPSTSLALSVSGDRTLPFDYVLVKADGAPLYDDEEAARSGAAKRTLTKGMSLAAARTRSVGDQTFVETVGGQLIPKEQLGWLGRGSEWSGVPLRGDALGPAFAWTLRDKTPVYAQPSRTAAKTSEIKRRQRIPADDAILSNEEGRWWPSAGGWIPADLLNEVVIIEPPPGVLQPAQVERGNDQWIDVDLGEQVLVAYRGGSPVFTTLIASGKGSPTPRGNYPIWAKVASMTMANQDYEDNPYMVEHVPWVLLFQGHNALHGAYWHDRFGQSRSHGCVNLAPKDARWLFEWVTPALPEGWTGYLPGELARSVVVHVRDSSLPPAEAFIQERPIGPPDPALERQRLEEAEERRAKRAEADTQALALD
ncbi:MAG: L,D-transpeptidase [Nannocystis sp.]|nr:L,D-transpeptidase [Nannocystis sp.]